MDDSHGLISCVVTLILVSVVRCQTCNSLGHGKDIAGNDIGNGAGPESSCCSMCSQHEGCKAYAWNNYNGGTCWLKSATGPIVKGKGVTVGVLSGGQQGGCSGLENDKDITGNDIGSESGKPESSCCEICAQKDGCQAYVWNDYNGGTCWLKSATGPTVSNPGVKIGLRPSGPEPPPPPPPTRGCGDGWQILKQYNFGNKDQVRQDWDIKVWPRGKVNNEKQAYTNSENNLFTNDGHLVIKAIKEGDGFTSGRIESKQKFSPKNAPGNKLKVEFTSTVPAVMGAWPALWMLGTDGQYGPHWPLNGEIDVMEWVWQIKDKILSSLHWKGPTDWSGDFTQVTMEEVKSNFITYGVEYSTGADQYIQFYIRKPSGETLYTKKATPEIWQSSFTGNCKPNCPPMAPFDADMVLILNLAVGGEWGGCCGVTNYDAFNEGVEMKISDVKVCVLN